MLVLVLRERGTRQTSRGPLTHICIFLIMSVFLMQPAQPHSTVLVWRWKQREREEKKGSGEEMYKETETETEWERDAPREKQRRRQTHPEMEGERHRRRWRERGIARDAGCVYCIPRDHLLSIDTVLEDRTQRGFIGQNLSSLHTRTHTQSLQAIFL